MAGNNRNRMVPKRLSAARAMTSWAASAVSGMANIAAADIPSPAATAFLLCMSFSWFWKGPRMLNPTHPRAGASRNRIEPKRLSLAKSAICCAASACPATNVDAPSVASDIPAMSIPWRR